MKNTEQTEQIMIERFGHDTLLSVATVHDGVPYVRIVDAYYENEKFYIVTYALSNKMKQIEENPNVAVCGEWFTAHGIAENLGWVKNEENADIMKRIRKAFEAWYDNGHTNEEDKNTCVLCIRLKNAVLFSHGSRFDIEYF